MNEVRHDYYVYQLKDPRDGAVFYVGKGRGKRMYCHAKRNTSDTNFVKLAKIKEIKQSGNAVVEEIVVGGLSENEAYAKEKEMISLMKPQLTNIVGGIVTTHQSLYKKSLDMKSRVKSYSFWIATCGQEVIDSVTKMHGSPRAYYDFFMRVLDENIEYAEKAAA